MIYWCLKINKLRASENMQAFCCQIAIEDCIRSTTNEANVIKFSKHIMQQLATSKNNRHNVL